MLFPAFFGETETKVFHVKRINGQLTVDNLPGAGDRQSRPSREDKIVRPARGGPRDILIMGCIYRSIQKQTVKKLQGAEEWTAWKHPPNRDGWMYII